MQKLEIFQSLWAMEQRQPGISEPPLAQIFEQVRDAGFHGIGIDMGVSDAETVAQATPLFARYGLASLITAFPASIDDLEHVSIMADRLEARMVCVNARYFPFSVDDGAAFVRDSLALAGRFRTPVYFETHRFTLTNDLLYTISLLDAVPELQLVADLSHYVVGREFPQPVDAANEALVDRILSRSAALQGRVASREQVQVPLGFSQHRYWVEKFAAWWRQGIEHFRAHQPADATLNFMCELGPAPYAITDARGFDLSDRWEESLTLKRMIEQIWSDTVDGC